jgi:hypothetical protein
MRARDRSTIAFIEVSQGITDATQAGIGSPDFAVELLFVSADSGRYVKRNVPGFIVGRFWATPEVAWQAEDLEGGFGCVTTTGFSGL